MLSLLSSICSAPTDLEAVVALFLMAGTIAFASAIGMGQHIRAAADNVHGCQTPLTTRIIGSSSAESEDPSDPQESNPA